MIYIWHTYVCLTYIYTVKPPDMKQLLQLMRDVPIAAEWYKLGVELLGNDIALRSFQANHPNDVDKCCCDMFKKWLDVTPDASWSQIVTALNNIGMTAAANAISKQHKLGI